ncbi:hypothetical protein C7441_12544 [Pseudaminobacter salicylatoxidans]|uniref:Uncharacterized protein n=1 Tax=Pseudaminobacter salicylatoxidans TaxID=93369 RepID=A0A316BR58_PSESE|nr:hypothetical protein C7441_12544 [Pseudaminobacter salicylatoxidans]
MVQHHSLLPLRPCYFRILPRLAQLARAEKQRVSFTGVGLSDELIECGERVHVVTPNDFSLACAASA